MQFDIYLLGEFNEKNQQTQKHLVRRKKAQMLSFSINAHSNLHYSLNFSFYFEE